MKQASGLARIPAILNSLDGSAVAFKMHGAGNDFLMLIDGDLTRRNLPRELARILCDRRKSIGADGLVVIKDFDPSRPFASMSAFNSDGSAIKLCLNAARCAALVVSLISGSSTVTVQTGNVLLEAECTDGLVRLTFAPWFSEISITPLMLDDYGLQAWYVPLADPHVVALDPSSFLDSKHFEEVSLAVRWDVSRFVNGANYHAVERISASEFRIRSFERGVECETQACGSGCLAAMLALSSPQPVTFLTVGGHAISIGVLNSSKWWLEGPVDLAFVGTPFLGGII